MHSERGLDRLITFLDAVVAIAITLLVLPLVEILTGARPDEDLGQLLTSHAGQFGAALLSFAVIARFWWAHHELGEYVADWDAAFVLLNLVWVLTIVVLPFSTQVLAVYGRDRLAVATYIGTMTVSSACLSLLNLLLWRRPGLRREGIDARQTMPAALTTTGLLVVALVLGVVVQAVNYLGLLLLFLSEPVERLIRRGVPALSTGD